jgi:hypothetical protein
VIAEHHPDALVRQSGGLAELAQAGACEGNAAFPARPTTPPMTTPRGTSGWEDRRRGRAESVTAEHAIPAHELGTLRND